MPIYPVRQYVDSTALTAYILACALIAVAPAGARAQTGPTLAGARGGLTVDGELENYLRYVTVRDSSVVTPWTLRKFSARQAGDLAMRGDSAPVNPWRDSWMLRRERPSAFVVLPASFSVRYNSAYPYGYNDGPIWAGRGATVALSAGFAATAGPLSIVIEPVAYAAQNASFPLQPNGESGSARFRDGDYPFVIDRPQRFGNRTYSRVTGGESTIGIDVLGASAGFTTANQWWGPASSYPLILGNNAPGIPSIFLGTSSPRPVWIGTVHARAVYGLETQSAFSPVAGADTFVSAREPGRKRAMAALVAVYQPRWIPHLELGGIRYFHLAWQGHPTRSGLSAPFFGLFNTASSTEEATGSNPSAVNNQLASAFFRWTLPRSGLEVYSEYAREDHNYDLRDLAEEPDHSRFMMAGFRKSFVRPDGALSALRIEYVDAMEPTLGRHRPEGDLYTHTVLRQGHTMDGQLLGAPIGVGSFAGAIIAWDRYTRDGRTSWFVQRWSQNNARTFLDTGVANNYARQLSGTLGVERYALRRTADLMFSASLTDAKRGPTLHPSVNLNLTVAVVPHSTR